MQTQTQGHLLHIIFLLIAGKCPQQIQLYCFAWVCSWLHQSKNHCFTVSDDVRCLCDLFDVWPYLLFCYLVEVNWIPNHLFQNVFDWCLSLMYANPPAYKYASPEVPLHIFASPNGNTTKVSQCFLSPPNHTAVIKRMPFRSREKSARGKKMFWMQSWGLVGWCEF